MKPSYTISYVMHDRKLNALIRFRVCIILIAIITVCVGLAGTSFAQARLEIPKKGEFKLEKDTLILDELIIGDSAKIILTRPTSMIRARHIVIGARVRIMGLGEKGVNGRDGRTAARLEGVCKPGRPGEDGKPGTAGGAGKNLIIDVDKLTIESMLIVNLAGGNGGDGGKGGDGSSGSNSLTHCVSNGGNGGAGGSGGAAGAGGNITIINSLDATVLSSKINLYNRAGYKGVGGEGGAPGLRGEGSSKESKHGLIGKVGIAGAQGIDGKSLFHSVTQATQ